MSELEEQARKRIANLYQQIEVLEEYLRITEQTRTILAGVGSSTGVLHAQGVSGPASASAPPDSAESPASPRIRDNPKPAVLIPAVIEILRESGHPMSRRQIHEALSDRGLVVRGAEPTKTLGTILWRARGLIGSIEGRGYWPAGDPVPESMTVEDLLSLE